VTSCCFTRRRPINGSVEVLAWQSYKQGAPRPDTWATCGWCKSSATIATAQNSSWNSYIKEDYLLFIACSSSPLHGRRHHDSDIASPNESARTSYVYKWGTRIECQRAHKVCYHAPFVCRLTRLQRGYCSPKLDLPFSFHRI